MRDEFVLRQVSTVTQQPDRAGHVLVVDEADGALATLRGRGDDRIVTMLRLGAVAN
jgi:hypothetical protein